MNLNGKTVVVIGAGSGVGRAVAVARRQRGRDLDPRRAHRGPAQRDGPARLRHGPCGRRLTRGRCPGVFRVDRLVRSSGQHDRRRRVRPDRRAARERHPRGTGGPGIVDSGPFWSRLTPEGRERMFADFALLAPAKRVGVPAEHANPVLFALTNPFLTGSVLPIDGGALLM